MAKKERKEDLNPRSEDVEEKVKRMMDPSIPDEPELPKASKSNSSAKSITIQSVSTPAKSDSPAAPSAPELPSETKAKSTSGKKVSIPIIHHGEEVTKSAETTPAPPVKKIAITEHGAGAEDVAEKLDEAIAELGTAEQAAEATKDASAIPAEPEAPAADGEIPLKESTAVESPETDKAVDEIVAAEGDELLEVEDAIRDSDEPVKPEPKTRRSLRQLLKDWWAKPAFRKGVVVTSAVVVVAVLAVPWSRYFVLNSVGIRASSSVLVLDQSTRQPLKNVKVSIGTVSGLTDETGEVKLQKVRLGTNQLVIEKRAFAEVSKKIVVGLGSNPLGDYQLVPTGSQYSFSVVDFLSGKPIAKAEASSGEANAISDDKGEIKLTIDKEDDAQFTVTIAADGYRKEEVPVDPNDKAAKNLKLVPERKQVFVTKRSGKFDIYSVYIDGKDETLVLAGSGHEREDMVLVPHPSDNVVAYVSTRAGQANKDGYLMSNLLMINLEDNSTTNVGASERIQVIDWIGDRLVYVQIAAGTSGNSPGRYKLMSYDYKQDSAKELASSNYFNDVVAAAGSIYYAPSSAYQTGTTGFYRVNPDGTNVQTVFNQEVWNIYRTAYDRFALAVEQQWYDYKFGDKAPTKLANAPASQVPRVYINSPDGKHSIWSEVRDGKGVLLNYDINGQKDASLRSQSGLGYPLRWLNNSTLVYRVVTSLETADYAISVDGGEPVKIKDVTNSGGIDRWYYY